MRYLIVALVAVAACSKSDPSPAPAKPEPAKPEPAKPEPAEPEPAKPEPAKPEPVVQPAGDAYLVWTPVGEGYETVLVQGGQVTATRPQAMVFAGGSLWGVEYRYHPFRERECDFEDPDAKHPLGPKKHFAWAQAKALAGDSAGNELGVVPDASGYFDSMGEVAEITGDFDGRTIWLSGGAGDVLLVRSCEGAFTCGAHGNWDCTFQAIGMDGTKPPIDLAATTTALAPDTKALRDAWLKDLADFADEVDASVEAVTLLANKGEPRVKYLLATEVPYVATDGDWGSYYQSRDHVGAAVPALGLEPTPPEVVAHLKTAGIDGAFGWSKVPADALAKVKTALEDKATLPAPKPDDEASGAPAEELASLIDRARKATREKQYAEAISIFTGVLDKDPKRARAYSGRGYAFLLSGERAKAKQDFEKALTLEDDTKFQAAVHFNLGEVAEADGDKAAALAAYEKANTLSPSKQAEARIAKLKAK